ncbi:MAG: sigma-70 family RNA polymerase sigma factor [Actinomycetota bacterium]|nr:sigma-70 family RNA polymerase sigma factor [Actinomycetota bacterium]
MTPRTKDVLPIRPRAQHDDVAAVADDFALLFDRHSVAVHRYLARRLGPSIADDLLGQTFLIAYERRASYDRTRSDARPWLYGIATNLVHRHQRDEIRQYRAWGRSGVDPLVADNHAQRVAERVDAEVWSGRLAAVLADLTEPDRDVLLLFAWGGLSYLEIAESLDIPVGTVRSRLHRARTAARGALTETEGD